MFKEARTYSYISSTVTL